MAPMGFEPHMDYVLHSSTVPSHTQLLIEMTRLETSLRRLVLLRTLVTMMRWIA